MTTPPPYAPDIAWVNGIATLLSLCGELFMLISYYFLPSIRTYSMKLIICLVTGDFFYSVANLLTYINSDFGICRLEGFLRQSSIMSTLFWVVVITHTSYKQLSNLSLGIKETKAENLKKLILGCLLWSFSGTLP